MDDIDRMIIKLLEKSEEPLSTYKIAKEGKIAWSTTNIHCYKLKSMGILREKTIDAGFGRRKVLWRLTAKTLTLDRFVKK